MLVLVLVLVLVLMDVVLLMRALPAMERARVWMHLQAEANRVYRVLCQPVGPKRAQRPPPHLRRAWRHCRCGLG